MKSKNEGIIVAGSLIADVFYKVDSYPQEGLLSKIRATERHIGGSGNLILDLAKMDPSLPVRVSAVVGAGSHGDMLLQALGRFPNIDCMGVTRQGDSSVTLVMNAQDTRQRTFFFLPAASDVYDESFIDWERLQGRIFHLEYLLLMARVDAPDEEYGTHGAKILHEAQRRGMKTSIDMVSEQGDRARQVVRSALRYTDYCSINEVEAQAVTGVELLREGRLQPEQALPALQALRQLGVSTWAVIHAPEQSFGLDCQSGEFFTAPSLYHPPGYIKGTNGAGDAFCSGILYGAYTGMPLPKALRYATACASCSLSEENGTDGMRSCEEIWQEEARYHR